MLLVFLTELKIMYHQNYIKIFESHLAYDITAWGGVSDKKLQSLFKVQKRCLGNLFGDKETYLNKFKTWCRVRPYDHQKLENSFYEKEHSKPIFNEKFIMTVHNLYVYHCSNKTLKIMKYRTPISMFNVFKTSNRKTTQMVPPILDIQYVYNASITWNWARQVIKSNTDTSDFSFSYLRITYLRITYFCLKKWAILASGINTGTSWCYFDFYEIYQV